VFLAKSGLFKVPVLGRLLRAVEQTPVERGTIDAVKALEAAVATLKDGKCVLIYPEGTTTREPELWPMRGKTGAARLWLATGAPVVPVVMWGPQRLFDPRTHKMRPLRTDVAVVTGPALDLSRWEGAAPTPAVLNEITDHIMLALRDLLAPLRPDETPPPLWTPGRKAAQGSAGSADGDVSGAES